MASKVIKLPLIKKSSLSRPMIVALVEASVRQTNGIPFGPADIKGSFSFLIERGLVVLELVNHQNEQQYVWRVTPEAITILTQLGIAKSA